MSVDAPPSTLTFTASREAVSTVLQTVGRAVSSRSSVQILGGILLRTTEDSVEAAATDMELSLRAKIDATVAGPGSVVVPGRVLLDIVRVLPPGEVTFAQVAGESTMSITCGSASYRVHTYDATDFPELPTASDDETFTLPREPFLETLATVGKAASKDESRPVLTGILIRLSGDKLVMAATDSYRLSVKEKKIELSDGVELDAVVPARALNEVARLGAAADDAPIEVAVHQNQILFGCGGVWLSARRIDGQFPNYDQLKPDSFDAEMRASRDELADVVRRVAVLAQRNTALRLGLTEGELSLRSQTQDVGEAHETMPVTFTGEPIEIGFNPAFFLEGLESISTDEVVLRLINPLRPGLLSDGSEDFWYLIMPIRLAS
jgi:DNA polymerase-3 subunit beta